MNEILFGDCRESLRALAARGIKAQTCVTSPPYFGLRDYGTGTWTGGDAACDHVSHEIRTGKGMAAWSEQYRGGGKKASEDKPVMFRAECGKCGAVREDQQIGLEETPEQYIAAMVEVFRAVRDVLANDGTLWVNIGDSYAANRGSQTPRKSGNAFDNPLLTAPAGHGVPEGLKQKDLIGIPWMLAFALRADGWYLRQDIIWHKPNPMPESVTDRCTKAHEYVFLLSKSPRYFYDAEAVKEAVAESTVSRLSQPRLVDQIGSARVPGKTNGNMKAVGSKDVRNRRSVWTVATRPYKGAHFATFPPALIEPCILAGSRAGDIVLDPFMGSGTTAAVAIQHGRQFLGCELNADYKPLQDERIAAARAARSAPAKVRKLAKEFTYRQLDIFEEAA